VARASCGAGVAKGYCMLGCLGWPTGDWAGVNGLGWLGTRVSGLAQLGTGVSWLGRENLG
jgi:hypothetical protein